LKPGEKADCVGLRRGESVANYILRGERSYSPKRKKVKCGQEKRSGSKSVVAEEKENSISNEGEKGRKGGGRRGGPPGGEETPAGFALGVRGKEHALQERRFGGKNGGKTSTGTRRPKII